ncbi:MAG: FtsX-like permease family protein [Patescibacteria group bacterium]
MLFLRLIIKNLFNRKTRTILTIVGISIGIATIVIFGMVTNGLTNTLGTAFKPGKADFSVAKAGVADMIVSIVTDQQIETIRNTEGVEAVVPYVISMTAMQGNPYFIVGGVDPDDVSMLGAHLTDGRIYENGNEMAIGRITAKNSGLKVGDTLTIKNKGYKIVGIFETGVTLQDGGAATMLAEAQQLQGLKSDQVSIAMVKIKTGYSPRQVADSIEAADSGLLGIVNVDDYGKIDQGLVVVDSISWVISVLAIVIGGIGVMNTIIMSVFERTREIGVLRALGWKRKRIMAMVLGEAIFIALIAAVIGILLGLGIVWLLMQTSMGRAFLDMSLNVSIFLQALAVAVGVVIFGAAYPAFRASRFSPMEALRYE